MGSIRDALNSFGTATAAGELPNKIYVGRTLTDGSMAYGHPRPPEGGEVSIPYYVEFCATDSIAPPTGVCTLNVYGSDENDSVTAPTGNWRLVGSLEVPAGKAMLKLKNREGYNGKLKKQRGKNIRKIILLARRARRQFQADIN
jgi:hypothetical protein